MGRMRSARRAGLAIAITAVAATVTGCGSDRREVALAGSPYAREVNEAVPKIEKAVGLPFKTPPKIEARSRDEVRQFLEQRFNDDAPADEIAGQERTYKRFGMIPDSLKLRDFMLELLTEQIVGYYDPKPKVLYVVQGADETLLNVTVTHELVHALQDQYLNLDSLQNVRGANDTQLAAQAVIEGQATFEQLNVMLGGDNMAARLPGGWDRLRQTIRESQASMPIFSSAPLLIQETLIFPYLSGAEFVRRFKDQNPGKSPLDALPRSTEQILHESAYGPTPDEPTTVTLPPPAGGKVVYQNGLGEFETRLFLYEHLKDQGAASRGASGWDGDSYVLFESGNGEGLAWLSVWDTSIEAAEFHDLLDTSVLKRFGAVKPASASQSTRVYTARGRSIALTATEIRGRPVVLYVDVPAGAKTDVLDLSKVVLEER